MVKTKGQETYPFHFQTKTSCSIQIIKIFFVYCLCCVDMAGMLFLCIHLSFVIKNHTTWKRNAFGEVSGRRHAYELQLRRKLLLMWYIFPFLLLDLVWKSNLRWCIQWQRRKILYYSNFMTFSASLTLPLPPKSVVHVCFLDGSPFVIIFREFWQTLFTFENIISRYKHSYYLCFIRTFFFNFTFRITFSTPQKIFSNNLKMYLKISVLKKKASMVLN